jgi:hypothetical protein
MRELNATDNMKPPIFVWQPAGLSAFSFLEAAESRIDVDQVKQTLAYDCEGRRLRLLVQKKKHEGGVVQRRVKVREAHEKTRTTASELRSILLVYLGGKSPTGSEADLGSLVALAGARAKVR